MIMLVMRLLRRGVFAMGHGLQRLTERGSRASRRVRLRHGAMFFFQAEDGIRDDLVTGVQTCALPISMKDVWVYTFEGNGVKLYSRDVDYTEVADYYKGDPDGGYKSYVFTDALSAETLVALRDKVERDVRKALNIPFNAGRPAERFEHSMGQQGLPPHILRKSAGTRQPV